LKGLTKRQNIIGLLIFGLVVTFGLFMAYIEDKGLKTNKTIIKGTVYEITTYYNSPGTVFIKYHYFIGNKQFNGQSSIASNSKYDDRKYLSQMLIGFSFPVIYDSTDFDNSRILLSKKDYEKYEVGRPDTLARFYYIIDSIQNVK
jgi:hypothetical protein